MTKTSPAATLAEFELMVMVAAMRLDDDAHAVSIAADINERTGRRVLDVVAHVAQWEEYAAECLEAFAAGKEFLLPPPFEIHAVNQRIFEAHRTKSPAEVRAFLDVGRARLLAAARGIPGDRWAGPVTYPWGAKGGVEELLVDMRGHDKHHEEQVRRVTS